MFKVNRSIVPSFFTVGNMFCGFYSVISTFNGKITMAAWMIFAAAFFDAMDGKVARFTNSSSKFGVEYDSLADVISFGFAPSILMFEIYFKSLGIVGILISFFPLLFGSIRLARFNTQLKGLDKEYFSGLPIPVAALTLSSSVIFLNYFYETYTKFPKLLLVLIGFISILMVSKIKYEIMPDLNFKGSIRDKLKVLILIISIIVVIIFPQQTIFPLMMLYIFLGIISWLVRLVSTNSSLKEGT